MIESVLVNLALFAEYSTRFKHHGYRPLVAYSNIVLIVSGRAKPEFHFKSRLIDDFNSSTIGFSCEGQWFNVPHLQPRINV